MGEIFKSHLNMRKKSHCSLLWQKIFHIRSIVQVRMKVLYVFFTIFLLLMVFFITHFDYKFSLNFKSINDEIPANKMVQQPSNKSLPEVVIATVACWTRLEEVLNMVKSALLLNIQRAPLKFIIVTEPNLFPYIEEKLNIWQSAVHFPLTYEIHPTQFPEDDNMKWQKLFQPCSSQRLFLPVS